MRREAHAYTDEQRQWLAAHAALDAAAAAAAFTARFGVSRTKRDIWSIRYRLHAGAAPRTRRYTKEEQNFIRSHIHFKLAALTDAFNRRFPDAPATKRNLSQYCTRHKLRTRPEKGPPEQPVECRNKGGVFIRHHRKYVRKGRWVYEQLHGPLPPGMQVIHLDNNPENCTPENLRAVTGREKIILARHELFTTFPALTAAGLNLIQLQDQLNDCHLEPEPA